MLCGLLAFPPTVIGQTFVAPKPEAAQPRAPHKAPVQQRRRQPVAATPVSVCVQMTEDWVDYRPVLDFPALQGRVTQDLQTAALAACESEQRARPNDLRIAFIFARTLEVNNKGVRATPLFRQLMDAGHAPAMTQLARAYYFGSGVAPDRVQACDLYVKAAAAGDPWAYNPAADCLSFQDYTHDPRLACRYFQRAQANGTFQTSDLTREDYCQ
jgi:TPR repeat protein